MIQFLLLIYPFDVNYLMILRFNFHIKFWKNSRLDGIDIEVSDQSVFVSKCFRCLFVFSWPTMVMFFSPVCTCVQNNDLDLITMAHAVVCFVTDLLQSFHQILHFCSKKNQLRRCSLSDVTKKKKMSTYPEILPSLRGPHAANHQKIKALTSITVVFLK